MRLTQLPLAITILIASLVVGLRADAQSHPPLRKNPPPSQRPMAKGPAFFMDAKNGDDKNDGSRKAPWRTVRHSLTRLKAGDTLYLFGGTYYENVYLALVGRKDAVITIRSLPGEQAILDGSLREFFEAPATAWEPNPKGAKGEYRSSKRYPNLRDVLGSFGDSMIGLQTYHHAQDFRSDNEKVDWEDWKRPAETDIKPLYCGPGLWYDRATGTIHSRLAHTHLPEPVPNYRGPDDPRKLPLIVTPFHSVTLHMDHARHVVLQDLVIRGGGYRTVVIDHGVDVEFDNVTVWCGTYGIVADATGPFFFFRSALYGNVAPWTFRTDGSKRDYPGRPHRNISRLNTHALLEIDSGRESSVYATPQNDRWEIAHSEFTDAHDGPYLGGINVRFHHNLLDNFQDDGLYLSPMYHRHRLEKTDPEIHIYQNVFRQMLTALAFGGPETTTRDKIFIYRNLIELRAPVPTGRPTAQRPEPAYSTGKVIGDHGSPPWPALNIYHNTFISGGNRQADMATFAGTRAAHPRRVFNNLFYHLDRLPAYWPPSAAGNVIADGNLFWAAEDQKKGDAKFFAKFRASADFELSKKIYPHGSSTHCLVADPLFLKAEAGDYRLQKGSRAVDAGAAVPAEWPDPMRALDKGRLDIGAFPLGSERWLMGR